MTKYNALGEEVIAFEQTTVSVTEVSVDVMRLSSTDTSTNYNSTAQAISWDTEDIAATGASMSWSSGADTRFTIDTTGTFHLTAIVALTSTAQMVNVKAYFRKNGSTDLQGFGNAFIRGSTGVNEAAAHVSIIDQFAVTDYIEVMCVQEGASGTANLLTGDSIFFGQKLGVDP